MPSCRVCCATLLLCLVALTGCSARHQANGLFPVTLQTDWYPQPEMGGFFQARLEGLYKAQGLDVTIAPGGPYITSDQQVSTGAAQFGMSSSDRVLTAVARGLPLIAVAATMQQDPQAVMVHAASPVHSFADLEGRTIAAQPGSSWFQYLLKRYNLHKVREIPATYSVANFLQDPEYIQQVFVTSEPYFATKAGAQVRTMLISSTGYQPYRVFFTSQPFLKEHPEMVAKFVRASLQGWQDYLRDPSMTNAEIARLNPAMNPEQMRFTVQTLKEQHFVEGAGTADSHLGHFTRERWATIYRQLADLGMLAKPIDPASAYTLQFAP